MTSRSFLAAALATVLLATTVALTPRLVAETLPDPTPSAASGPLDGMVFSGVLGPADSPDHGIPDTLYFRNGHFWSEQCIPCGFQPGRYWVHQAADGIHFRGELSSPEGGTFKYAGVVRDDQVATTIDWRKERWYWTIDREFRFQGALSDDDSSLATLQDAQEAAISARQSGSTCKPD